MRIEQSMIAVVNTGVGNLRSVLLAFNRACPEVNVRIASERKTLRDASKGSISRSGVHERLY